MWILALVFWASCHWLGGGMQIPEGLCLGFNHWYGYVSFLSTWKTITNMHINLTGLVCERMSLEWEFYIKIAEYIDSPHTLCSGTLTVHLPSFLGQSVINAVREEKKSKCLYRFRLPRLLQYIYLLYKVGNVSTAALMRRMIPIVTAKTIPTRRWELCKLTVEKEANDKTHNDKKCVLFEHKDTDSLTVH